MTLTYDPGAGQAFTDALRAIPGYPAGEDLPIRTMVFGRTRWRSCGRLLRAAGAVPEQPLPVVMDRTPMLRDGADLKPLVLAQLRDAGWQPEAIVAGAGRHRPGAHRLRPDRRVQARPDGRDRRAGRGLGHRHRCGQARRLSVRQEDQGGAPLPFVVYQTANSVSAYTSQHGADLRGRRQAHPAVALPRRADLRSGNPARRAGRR